MNDKPSAHDHSINSARNQFPGIFSKRTHTQTTDKNQIIYLDSAGSTQLPWPVIRRLNAYYTNEHANPLGQYHLGKTVLENYENARRVIANFIGASPHQIIFTSGIAENYNLISEFLTTQYDTPKIAITDLDKPSNTAHWNRHGFEIVTLETNKINQDSEIPLDININAVSICARNTTLGLDPLWQQLSRNATIRYGMTFHLDASDWVAHEPLNIQNMLVDFLSFSADKLYGPVGLGILVVNDSIRRRFSNSIKSIGINPLENNDYAKLPELAETCINSANVLAFAESCKFLDGFGFDAIKLHESSLMKHLVTELKSLTQIELVSAEYPRTSLSLMHKSKPAIDVFNTLIEKGIYVGFGQFDGQDVITISLAIYNTEDDINVLVSALKELE